MTEFEIWFAGIEKEYPLYQDKDGYNIGNTPALKVGWEASKRHYLRWVLDHCHHFQAQDIIDAILEKLKEKT